VRDWGVDAVCGHDSGEYCDGKEYDSCEREYEGDEVEHFSFG
jgi:hypothetical protein